MSVLESESMRLVWCWCCGNPTGGTGPGGQSDFPVCRGCTNIKPPSFSDPVNVPGDVDTLYCMDTYMRDNRIRQRGGVIPVVVDARQAWPDYDAYEGPPDDVPVCDNCGSTQFLLLEEYTGTRLHRSCNQRDTGVVYVVYDTYEEDDDTTDQWVECASCNERYNGEWEVS